jgi:hypothetical protein
MLIGYGGYVLTPAISSSGGGAAFLTSSAALTDARTGSATSCKWDTGTQTTATHVDIALTIADPLDTTAAIGVVGVANVQGLPAGTKLTFNGVTQRLVPGERGELGAWWLPAITGNSGTISIFNDVNGSASISNGATFAIGEIFVGRVLSMPTLIGSPGITLIDPTQFQRSSGGQLWQNMRNPWRQYAAQLGPFTTTNAKGGSLSTIVSGSNPAGTIDVRTLRGLLSTTTVCAVCDTPSAGQGAGSVAGGIRYDQNFMQPNWMIARPSQIGDILLSMPPLWTWNPIFMEAT